MEMNEFLTSFLIKGYKSTPVWENKQVPSSTSSRLKTLVTLQTFIFLFSTQFVQTVLTGAPSYS